MTREEIQENLDLLDELKRKLDDVDRRVYRMLVRASLQGLRVGGEE